MALVTTTTEPASRRFDLSTILEPGSTAVLGEVGSGKTYLATQAIGHALSDGKRTLLFDHYGEYSAAQAVADQLEQISDDAAFCDRLTYMNPADHADVIVVAAFEALSERTQERLRAFMHLCRTYDLAVIILGHPRMQLPESTRQVLVGRCLRERLPRAFMSTGRSDAINDSDREIAVIDHDGLRTYDPLD